MPASLLKYIPIRCLLFFLPVLLAVVSGSATPFLQQIERATPANRVILVLNYFDTCQAVTKNQANAVRLLSQIETFGKQAQDEQLVRYCRFLHNTQAKHSNPSHTQNAALFLAVGQEAERNSDLQIAAVCQHFAGQYYFLAEDYGKAFEYLLAANDQFRSLGYQNIPEIQRYLYELALNYYYFNEHQKVIDLLQVATRYSAFNVNIALQTYNTMGLAYLRVSQLARAEDVKKAEASFNRAMQIAKASHDKTWQGNIYGNLSKIYLHQNRIGPAIAALRFDYTASLQHQPGQLLPDQAALSLARAYLMRRQLDSSAFFLRESARFYRLNSGISTFGSNLADESYVRNYCDVARLYYRAINDLPSAYRFLDSMAVLDKRINKRYNSEQVSLVAQKLLIQKHQLEVSALQTAQQKQQWWFWTIGSMLAVVAGLFVRLYQLSRLKRQQEALANAERQKRLQLEKQQVADDLERAKAELAVFMDSLPQASSAVRDVQHSLYQASLLTKVDWEEFQHRFDRVYPQFFAQLRAQFTDLTPAEERLLALSKLNVGTQRMGRMLGISTNSIRTTKYRLRKKLGVGGNSPLSDLLD